MKKIIFLLSFLSLVSVSFAQGSTTPEFSNNCSIVTTANYASCCPSSASVPSYACFNYKNRQNTLPGQVNSNSVNTGPVNKDIFFNPTSGSSISTPASTSSSLSQCSNIKFSSLIDILSWIKCIIGAGVIPLIFALAFVFFLWGVLKFIGASDSTKKEEGKKFIIAGLVGLFVMVSVWGIIAIVGNTLGTNNSNVVPLLQTK